MGIGTTLLNKTMPMGKMLGIDVDKVKKDFEDMIKAQVEQGKQERTKELIKKLEEGRSIEEIKKEYLGEEK
jgi:uncharacterized protein (DUF433 family)